MTRRPLAYLATALLVTNPPLDVKLKALLAVGAVLATFWRHRREESIARFSASSAALAIGVIFRSDWCLLAACGLASGNYMLPALTNWLALKCCGILNWFAECSVDIWGSKVTLGAMNLDGMVLLLLAGCYGGSPRKGLLCVLGASLVSAAGMVVVLEWAGWKSCAWDTGTLQFVVTFGGLVILSQAKEKMAAARPRIGLAHATVVTACVAWCLIWHQFAVESQDLSMGRVVVWDRGLQDWGLPKRGQYGAGAGGMLGYFALEMARSGHELCHHSADEDVTRMLGALGPTDCLMLINCNYVWPAPEWTLLDKWIRDGGRLIIVGDHTDAADLMSGTNSIVEKYGARLRFDSVVPPWNGWRHLLRVPDGLAAGPTLVDSASSNGVHWAIGCSIDCDPSWQQRVVGTWALRDSGVSANRMGNKLGNYERDLGEAIGDSVLVAARPRGKGWISLFGDCTFIQYAALLQHPTDVLELLDGPKHWLGLGLNWGMLACLLGACAYSLSIQRGHRVLLVRLMTILALVTLMGSLLKGTVVASERSEDVAVLLDVAPEIGQYDCKLNSIGPLMTECTRAGLTCRERTLRTMPKSVRCVCVIAPKAEIAGETAEALDSFILRGGRVVVVASGAHSRCVNSWLAKKGCYVEPEICRLSSRDEAATARSPFSVPSCIRLEKDRDWMVLASIDGRPVAVGRNVGRGGLACVGDSRFFAEDNMEGIWGYSKEAIQLADVILDWVRDGEFR